jgi:hypothetical protein
MEMQQTHYYTTGTATLPWKCNMVHRSCYQGKPNMSQYYLFEVLEPNLMELNLSKFTLTSFTLI